MDVLQRHAHNLYLMGRRTHRDERGTEAVEWIAVGAALFIIAAGLSVVLDLNGARLGNSLMGQVQQIIGKMDNGGRSQPQSTFTTVAESTAGQTAATNRAGAAGDRDAINEAANFDKLDIDSTETTVETTNDGSAQGSMIIEGNQLRQDSVVAGTSEPERVQKEQNSLQKAWAQLGAIIAPITDAVHEAFSSMFREKR